MLLYLLVTMNRLSFSTPDDLNSFITSMLPMMLNSLMLLRPSGLTERMSILVFLAMTRFKPVGLVKFP